MDPIHIVIMEPNHRGHRYSTVRVLLDSIHDLQQEHPGQIASITLATTSDGLQSDEYQTHLANPYGKFNIHTLPRFDTARHPWLIGLEHLRNLKELLKTGRFNHIYVPFADALLQMMFLNRLARLGKRLQHDCILETQIMHNSFAYPFAKLSRRLLSYLSVKYSGCDRIHINDPLAIEILQQRCHGCLDHIRLIPDPITATVKYNKIESRRKLELPLHGRIIACLGNINRRKGADTLIEAFIQAELPQDVYLFLAGKIEDVVADQIAAVSNHRIIAIDRYISEDEFSQSFSAADLVAIPYTKVVGSASIVIRSAISGRMVLTNNTGWCEYIVKQFDLGDTAPVDDIEQFATALAAAINKATCFHISKSAERFCQFNSTTNVHAHWTDLLRQRTDLPRGEMIHWNA